MNIYGPLVFIWVNEVGGLEAEEELEAAFHCCAVFCLPHKHFTGEEGPRAVELPNCIC